MKVDFNLKNHFFLKASTEIHQLAEPLLDFLPIHNFQFARIYADNHMVFISTNPFWTQQFFNEEYYKLTVASRHPSLYKSGFSLGDNWGYEKQKKTQKICQAFHEFNLGHRFLTLRVHKDYMDVLVLSGDINNNSLNETYLANIDIIEKFIDYFLIKGHHIISQAEQHRIFLSHNKDFLKPDSLNLKNTSDADKLLNYFKINRLPIKGPNGNIYLTEQETNCLKLYTRGMTVKEAAYQLGMSPRTAEKHIESIRRKLGLSCRSNLIQRIMTDPLINKIILEEP